MVKKANMWLTIGGVFCNYFASIFVIPAMYGRKTSGTVTEPSAFW